jgi:hypothetical protein
MTSTDLWTYSNTTISQRDLSGFSVEALDGGIGKVDNATYDVGQSFLVVDTGPWIFGKKAMLPAGVVRDVDLDTETVFVNRTKDQIKNAPEFDEDRYRDTKYRDELGGYYGPGGLGYREPS